MQSIKLLGGFTKGRRYIQNLKGIGDETFQDKREKCENVQQYCKIYRTYNNYIREIIGFGAR